ncbi:MAG: hypothetical protein FWE07_05850 [Turicibacter sp.]|nr:hypothetical protein [Turicibacter sp.]
MVPIYAFAFLIVIFAIGDIVADKTKALLSTVLVVIVLLLLSFWGGLPGTVINDSGIAAVGMPLVVVLIVGIGSNMDLKSLAAQWKTCVIALLGALSGVVLIMFVGQFILGRYMAFSAATVFSGTNVAILILTDALSNNNMVYLMPFLLMVFVTDNLVGIPVASHVLKKSARIFVKDKEAVKKYAAMSLEGVDERKRLITMPEFMKQPSGVLARIIIVGAFSFWLSGLTQGHVHFLVMSLIMGVIFTEIGFLDKASLPKTQASSFVILAATVVIFGSLADTTPQMFIDAIGPLLLTLGIGFIGVIIGSFFLGKFLKTDPWLAIAMGVSCSFGMPTTFLIPKEVAATIAENEEEQRAIENYQQPSMVTAGFVSVTIASVFIAQMTVTLLFG